MKKVLSGKIMALSLALIPITILGGCQKENSVAENIDNDSVFEAISQDESANSKESEEASSETEAPAESNEEALATDASTDNAETASTTEDSTECAESTSATETSAENEGTFEAESHSENDETSSSSRKDGERFEATIMLEGMDETVKCEHAVSDTLGFEIDYDYESLMRKSDADSEKFISLYDDAENPENYLEVTYISEDAEAALTSISEELSKSYDIVKDEYTLDKAGNCFRIDAPVAKDTAENPFLLQRVYIIPAGDGSIVATEHFTIESAEGFGRRFNYIMDTLVVTGRDSASYESSFGTSTREDEYVYEEFPLEREGIALHLDSMTAKGVQPDKSILLVHGVTYSSHEFDVDYEDYSLVRFLAREGYRVWRLDIAGFGQSGEVSDGFMPDSDYAAEDINAAVEKILETTGEEKIDLFGWSWGTVTTGRFAANYGEKIRKLVLFAPILSGVGEYEVAEAFHHNTWEHAADDFQKDSNGDFDYEIADKVIIELFCSNCWRYDGEESPNGGRRDICVASSEKLIDLSKIKVPTLVICGDNDPYLNYDLVNDSINELPQGSALEVIKGGSHVVYIEKPFYREFQEKLIDYLKD